MRLHERASDVVRRCGSVHLWRLVCDPCVHVVNLTCTQKRSGPTTARTCSSTLFAQSSTEARTQIAVVCGCSWSASCHFCKRTSRNVDHVFPSNLTTKQRTSQSLLLACVCSHVSAPTFHKQIKQLLTIARLRHQASASAVRTGSCRRACTQPSRP